MKEMLMSLLQAVIAAAVPVITVYLCKFLKTKKDATVKTTENETAKALLSQAFDAVCKAVTSTNQTYVDALKKSGTFTIDNQKEAFQNRSQAGRPERGSQLHDGRRLYHL